MCNGVNDCDGSVDEKHCTNGRNWYGRSPDGAISSSTPNDNSPQSIIIALSKNLKFPQLSEKNALLDIF